MITYIALRHHELLDHSGYPGGEELASEIHPLARIVAVVDAYDLATSWKNDEEPQNPTDFVEKVLKAADEAYEKKTLALARGIDLTTLIAAVAHHFELDLDIIISSSRQRTVAEARSIICCLAVDQLMIHGIEVARQLTLSTSAVSKLAGRGRFNPVSKKIARELFDFA